jgi:Fe-S-cluster containining protein
LPAVGLKSPSEPKIRGAGLPAGNGCVLAPAHGARPVVAGPPLPAGGTAPQRCYPREMGTRGRVHPPDAELIQIVDAALAEAVRKSGAFLACRPGCTACCIGPFPISQLDARRLQDGMAKLKVSDPARAARVRRRARESVARTGADFPGDPASGILDETPEAETRFETFADDEPCPALDPKTGRCDLYAWRPITCRAFGPAMRMSGETLAICELCYEGASEEQIAACAVDADFYSLEADLLRDLERTEGAAGQTIVAFALNRK